MHGAAEKLDQRHTLFLRRNVPQRHVERRNRKGGDATLAIPPSVRFHGVPRTFHIIGVAADEQR